MKNSSLLFVGLLLSSSLFYPFEDVKKEGILGKLRSPEQIEQIAEQVKEGCYEKLDEILMQIKDSMSQEDLEAAKQQLTVDGEISHDKLKELLNTTEIFADNQFTDICENILDRVIAVFGWNEDVKSRNLETADSSEPTQEPSTDDDNQESNK